MKEKVILNYSRGFILGYLIEFPLLIGILYLTYSLGIFIVGIISLLILIIFPRLLFFPFYTSYINRNIESNLIRNQIKLINQGNKTFLNITQEIVEKVMFIRDFEGFKTVISSIIVFTNESNLEAVLNKAFTDSLNHYSIFVYDVYSKSFDDCLKSNNVFLQRVHQGEEKYHINYKTYNFNVGFIKKHLSFLQLRKGYVDASNLHEVILKRLEKLGFTNL